MHKFDSINTLNKRLNNFFAAEALELYKTLENDCFFDQSIFVSDN